METKFNLKFRNYYVENEKQYKEIHGQKNYV